MLRLLCVLSLLGMLGLLPRLIHLCMLRQDVSMPQKLCLLCLGFCSGGGQGRLSCRLSCSNAVCQPFRLDCLLCKVTFSLCNTLGL